MKLGLDSKDAPAVAALLRLAMVELLDSDGASYCRHPSVAGAYIRALPNDLIPALITVVVEKAADDGKRATTLTDLILRMRSARGTFAEDSTIAEVVSQILVVAEVDVGPVDGRAAGWLGEARPHVLLALRQTLPEDLKQALRSPHDALGFIQSAYPGVYGRLIAGESA